MDNLLRPTAAGGNENERDEVRPCVFYYHSIAGARGVLRVVIWSWGARLLRTARKGGAKDF